LLLFPFHLRLIFKNQYKNIKNSAMDQPEIPLSYELAMEQLTSMFGALDPQLIHRCLADHDGRMEPAIDALLALAAAADDPAGPTMTRAESPGSSLLPASFLSLDGAGSNLNHGAGAGHNHADSPASGQSAASSAAVGMHGRERGRGYVGGRFGKWKNVMSNLGRRGEKKKKKKKKKGEVQSFRAARRLFPSGCGNFLSSLDILFIFLSGLVGWKGT
jgi:hypothetical protein